MLLLLDKQVIYLDQRGTNTSEAMKKRNQK